MNASRIGFPLTLLGCVAFFLYVIFRFVSAEITSTRYDEKLEHTGKAKGAPDAIRTHDTRFRRAVLYPLSYRGNEYIWYTVTRRGYVAR